MQSEINLDTEYRKVKGTSVAEMLSIDFVRKIPVVINLPRDINGLSSLRIEIKKYSRFCNVG